MAEPRPVLDHIAIAAARIADALPVLVGALGGVPESGAPSRGFNWGCWRYAGGGRIEVLEPAGEAGFLHRFLAHRGPGIHHVTFRVPSLPAACRRAEAHGYKIVGYDDSRPGWAEAFLHPKQALGIVVQLAESRRVPGAARRPPWQPPPGPADPPPPVRILGLRLRARAAEPARTQWETVLLGEGSVAAEGALAFRWPGSPTRIVVEVAPAAEEGPIAIEFASDCAVTLPEAPRRLLGTVFVQSD